MGIQGKGCHCGVDLTRYSLARWEALCRGERPGQRRVNKKPRASAGPEGGWSL